MDNREIITRLVDRLQEHKRLIHQDYQKAADFWDLRVNHVVGLWLRLGKPFLEDLQDLGFGFISEGSTTAGPIRKPEYLIGEVKECPKCKKKQQTSCTACGCGSCRVCSYRWTCMPVNFSQTVMPYKFRDSSYTTWGLIYQPSLGIPFSATYLED